MSKDTWEAKRWKTFLGAEGQSSIPQQAPGPCRLAAALLGGITGNGMVGTGVELSSTLLPVCHVTGKEMGLRQRDEGASTPSTSPRGWQVGALHTTGVIQTSPRRRAGLYLPIQMSAHLKPSQLSPDVHPPPKSPCQLWAPSPLCTFGCQPHCWLRGLHTVTFPSIQLLEMDVFTHLEVCLQWSH